MPIYEFVDGRTHYVNNLTKPLKRPMHNEPQLSNRVMRPNWNSTMYHLYKSKFLIHRNNMRRLKMPASCYMSVIYGLEDVEKAQKCPIFTFKAIKRNLKNNMSTVFLTYSHHFSIWKLTFWFLYYIWLREVWIYGTWAPRTPYGVPLGLGWPQDHAPMDWPRRNRTALVLKPKTVLVMWHLFLQVSTLLYPNLTLKKYIWGSSGQKPCCGRRPLPASMVHSRIHVI